MARTSAAFYGNNTLNPVGVWEGRPVPNSDLVMATAAAHHAMTAGSIILLDVSKGIDGLDPISRLTSDVLFPESEFPVQHWHAPAGVVRAAAGPGGGTALAGALLSHPLSAVGRLLPGGLQLRRAGRRTECQQGQHVRHLPGGSVREPGAAVPRCQHRQSLAHAAAAACAAARAAAGTLDPSTAANGEGTFFVQNVYDSWPHLPSGEENRVTHLRIVQVLLKTTPNANSPRVGFANASPGKQVLGTVPVEPDGSAYFRAPARIPLAFQALDRHGMAVQTMRSLTYLQPGRAHQLCGLPRASVQHAGLYVRRAGAATAAVDASRLGRTDPSR